MKVGKLARNLVIVLRKYYCKNTFLRALTPLRKKSKKRKVDGRCYSTCDRHFYQKSDKFEKKIAKLTYEQITCLKNINHSIFYTFL